jgi:Ser/Thr protein kinase RdoA (MazF antagonist)
LLHSKHIHRDHPALFENEALSLTLPSFAITAVVPLIDLTLETGSTRLWKGSHRASRSENQDMKDSYVPFLPTGSCYLMDYQLLHGGTPNVSQQVRPIIYMIYYRSWFQETVNYEKQSRLSITAQEYQKIPRQYQFLFARHTFEQRLNTAALEASPETSASLNAAPLTPISLSMHPDHQSKVGQFLLSMDCPGGNDEALGTATLPSPPDPAPDSALVNFAALTSREQAQKLGEVAKIALAEYGFKKAILRLISHGENTVFSVSIADPAASDSSIPAPNPQLYQPNRFILRVHRTHYLPTDAIESELRWLQMLRQEHLPIPEPVPTVTGALWTAVQRAEIPDPRVCSLTRWLQGRSLLDEPRDFQRQPQTLEAIGRLLGQLHHCASCRPVSDSLTRPCWNGDGLFGAGAGYSDDGDRVWRLTPEPYRRLFRTVGEQVSAVMADLGEAPAQFGLIHGDFWRGNLLVQAGTIGAIDFADCGFGYWGYDVARFLSDFSGDPHYPTYLEQLLSGYTQIRPFPDAQLPHLPLFMVAQAVTLALWRINRAQDHPAFRSTLAADLAETAATVEAFWAATA